MAPPRADDSHPHTKDLSLKRLSEAFAAAMGKSEKRAAAWASEEHETPGDAESSNAEDIGPSDDAEAAADVNPVSVLEAMLFVGHPENEPLTAEHAAALMRGVEPQEIHDLVAELNRRYDAGGHPYRVVSEGAGYRLVLREEFHRLRNKFYGRVRAARLSQAAIEVLSLVAYEQPLAREDIDRLRGIPSGPILRQLVRRRLLRLERTDTKPRQTLYYTTNRFLRLLGLDSLEDLPQALELERE